MSTGATRVNGEREATNTRPLSATRKSSSSIRIHFNGHYGTISSDPEEEQVSVDIHRPYFEVRGNISHSGPISIDMC